MSNEPLHPFLSDTPDDPATAKLCQRFFEDGRRVGREEGIRMLNTYLQTLHSVLGEAVIKDIVEKFKKIDEG